MRTPQRSPAGPPRKETLCRFEVVWLIPMCAAERFPPSTPCMRNCSARQAWRYPPLSPPRAAYRFSQDPPLRLSGQSATARSTETLQDASADSRATGSVDRRPAKTRGTTVPLLWCRNSLSNWTSSCRGTDSHGRFHRCSRHVLIPPMPDRGQMKHRPLHTGSFEPYSKCAPYHQNHRQTSPWHCSPAMQNPPHRTLRSLGLFCRSLSVGQNTRSIPIQFRAP